MIRNLAVSQLKTKNENAVSLISALKSLVRENEKILRKNLDRNSWTSIEGGVLILIKVGILKVPS